MLRIVALLMLLASPVSAQTLLYKSPCPQPAQNDPAYLAGVQAIRDAIDAGKLISVSMSYQENGQTSKFAVQLTAIKATTNWVSGLLALRPPINNDAQAISGSALVLGSVDSLSGYNYGTLGGTVTRFTCYENAFWAH